MGVSTVSGKPRPAAREHLLHAALRCAILQLLQSPAGYGPPGGTTARVLLCDVIRSLGIATSFLERRLRTPETSQHSTRRLFRLGLPNRFPVETLIVHLRNLHNSCSAAYPIKPARASSLDSTRWTVERTSAQAYRSCTGEGSWTSTGLGTQPGTAGRWQLAPVGP